MPLARPQTSLRLGALVLRPEVVTRAVIEALEAVTGQPRASRGLLLLGPGRSSPVGGGHSQVTWSIRHLMITVDG